MTESPRVDAFIAARQDQVLERAITTIDTAPAENLAAEAHRLVGTLGTFGLDEAAACVRTLEDVLRGPAVTADEVGEARAAALRGLEEIASARKER
jgi:HPt (histidine-containing phosphotransfer) domain-containing protein